MKKMISENDCPCEYYEKIYCEECGEEIDGINRTIGREFHGIAECLFSCSKCESLCSMCKAEPGNCNCLAEIEMELEFDSNLEIEEFNWLDIQPEDWTDDEILKWEEF